MSGALATATKAQDSSGYIPLPRVYPHPPSQSAGYMLSYHFSHPVLHHVEGDGLHKKSEPLSNPPHQDLHRIEPASDTKSSTMEYKVVPKQSTEISVQQVPPLKQSNSPQTNQTASKPKFPEHSTVQPYHTCAVCGRARSRGFHRDHPIGPRNGPISGICRRCHKSWTSTDDGEGLQEDRIHQNMFSIRVDEYRNQPKHIKDDEKVSTYRRVSSAQSPQRNDHEI